jgi:6-phosphogluconolactonase
MREIHVFDAADAVSAFGAALVARAAIEAIGARGRFKLALSGGRTPQELYRRLARWPESAGDAGAGGAPRARAATIDWNRVFIYFADERAVPPSHSESNFRMCRETLIDPAHIPPRNVHRMKGEYPDLKIAAIEYEAHVLGPLDLMILGIGEDGHTASLFPGSALIAEREHRVAFVENAAKPPPRRLTLTPRAIGEANDVIVLATGEEKAAAVAAAIEGDAPAAQVPARLLRDRTWLLDAAAAARLVARPPIEGSP